MTTPTYSQLQREYWVKRPADVIQYLTVEFYHPDFGYIRLVQNQYTNKFFTVDGVLQEFQAVSMELPLVTNQSTDTTKAGTINFGRIGVQVRQKLLMITPLGAIKYPIQVKLRQFENDDNIYERRVYVNKDGISISANGVAVQLSVNNPAKLTNEGAFYDPDVWTGLRTV